MPIVEISYVHLLHEIAEKLEMVVPQCGTTTNAEGQFVGYVDLQIPCEGSVAEVVRCWGGAFSAAAVAEQDAAHIAIHRLKEDLDLHIKDANYDDRFYYKNMYDHVTNQYATLFAKYGRVKWEFAMLKECHSSRKGSSSLLSASKFVLLLRNAMVSSTGLALGRSDRGVTQLILTQPSLFRRPKFLCCLLSLNFNYVHIYLSPVLRVGFSLKLLTFFPPFFSLFPPCCARSVVPILDVFSNV